MKFELPVVRVFFNKAGLLPRTWSIDCSPDSAEILVGSIQIRNLDSSSTYYDETPLNADLPRAVFIYTNVCLELDLRKSTAVLSPLYEAPALVRTIDP